MNYIIRFDSVYIPEKHYKKEDNLIIKEKFNNADAQLNINSGFITVKIRII
jgi:hypothetical protein